MKLLTSTLRHLHQRPLLALAVVAAIALVAESTGSLDNPVLAFLGNNPGNQGRA